MTWSYITLTNSRLSLHPLFDLKPDCHSLKKCWHSSTILRSITTVITTIIILYMWFSSSSSLYLMQSLWLPFFLYSIQKNTYFHVLCHFLLSPNPNLPQEFIKHIFCHFRIFHVFNGTSSGPVVSRSLSTCNKQNKIYCKVIIVVSETVSSLSYTSLHITHLIWYYSSCVIR